MRRTSFIVAVTISVGLILPAFAQQADAPHQSMGEKFKAKRQAFAARAKRVYFAAGCKILSAESASSLVNAESGVALAGDENAVGELAKRAEEAGMARASKPGQCDYFKRHPEEAEALRNAAAK
jgi:hypothetical protein